MGRPNAQRAGPTRDLAIWRAAHEVADTDLRPTGPPVPGVRNGYQQHRLDRRVSDAGAMPAKADARIAQLVESRARISSIAAGAGTAFRFPAVIDPHTPLAPIADEIQPHVAADSSLAQGPWHRCLIYSGRGAGPCPHFEGASEETHYDYDGEPPVHRPDRRPADDGRGPLRLPWRLEGLHLRRGTGRSAAGDPHPRQLRFRPPDVDAFIDANTVSGIDL